MKVFLHAPAQQSTLADVYRDAFSEAVELFVVSAYLTDWNDDLKLSKGLRTFRIIIGKDFGITRKDACLKVLKWLPSARKSQFLVADNIQGFHPKAMFWLMRDGTAHALVGSSNLTRAAFAKNYEANVLTELSGQDYQQAKLWIKDIERQSVVVSEDWIESYIENTVTASPKPSSPERPTTGPTIQLTLAEPSDIKSLLKARRLHLAKYRKTQEALLKLFRKCAKGTVSSAKFFEVLPTIWDWEHGNRLQGKGWERRGKVADFQALTKSFIKIFDAAETERDDVVVSELDDLADAGNPARRAFLSEMLCLAFPSEYPVLNQPVVDYLRAMKFRSPRGATEGATYVDIAKKLRSFIFQNPTHPAKTLAELDTIIWRLYGKDSQNATGKG